MSVCKVVLLAYTPEPEELCAVAMKSCQSSSPAHEIHFFTEGGAEKMIKLAKKLGHESVLKHPYFTFSFQEFLEHVPTN